MRRFVCICVLAAGWMAGGLAHAAAGRAMSLPRLNIDPSQITVSGFSSGGYAAVQMHVAFSSVFSGVAVFAGGPFGCAEGNVYMARGQCMKAPEEIDTAKYVRLARQLASQRHLDPLAGLAAQRIYLFSGSLDDIVRPLVSRKLAEFYAEFVDPDRIRMVMDVPASHGQPTLDFGNACDVKGRPWIQKCGYDGAGHALQHLYGRLRPRGRAFSSSLARFEQAGFDVGGSHLAAQGYLYVPVACRGGERPCRLHVALHGCNQGPESTDEDYYFTRSGYNEWAESNRIVVLYPTASASIANPMGCWDWWGYSSSAYLSKRAPQMRALRGMIHAISGA